MGPGPDYGKKSIMIDPPLFHPDQDLLVWRKKVAAWVDLDSTAANRGPDRTYKSIAATLAHHLYERALPQAQKSIVDEAQTLGQIDYKQDDQLKAVQQIVDVVAVDPTIAVVTRLIDSFNKVTSCKKKNDEDLHCFLSRYRGLAAEHLMRVRATKSSQVGEILAINLLQNACLPEATLTNAKISLIQLGESRKKDEEEDPHQLSAKNVDSLLDAFKELKEFESTLETDTEDSQDDAADVLMTILPVLGSVIKKLDEPFQEMQRSKAFRREEAVTRSITTTGPRCIVSLDDAVNVLRSLAQTMTKTDKTGKSGSPTSASEDIQKLVKEQLKSFFSDHNEKRKVNRDNRRGGNDRKRNKPDNNKGSPTRPYKRRNKQQNLDGSRKTNKVIDNDVC